MLLLLGACAKDDTAAWGTFEADEVTVAARLELVTLQREWPGIHFGDHVPRCHLVALAHRDARHRATRAAA